MYVSEHYHGVVGLIYVLEQLEINPFRLACRLCRLLEELRNSSGRTHRVAARNGNVHQSVLLGGIQLIYSVCVGLNAHCSVRNDHSLERLAQVGYGSINCGAVCGTDNKGVGHVRCRHFFVKRLLLAACQEEGCKEDGCYLLYRIPM